MIIVTTLACLVGMIVLIGIIVVLEERDRERRSQDAKRLCVHQRRGYCRLTHDPCEICALYKTENDIKTNEI